MTFVTLNLRATLALGKRKGHVRTIRRSQWHHPVSYLCPRCGKCTDTKCTRVPSIQCDLSQIWWHARCAQIKIVNYGDDDDWECPSCKDLPTQNLSRPFRKNRKVTQVSSQGQENNDEKREQLTIEQEAQSKTRQHLVNNLLDSVICDVISRGGNRKNTTQFFREERVIEELEVCQSLNLLQALNDVTVVESECADSDLWIEEMMTNLLQDIRV